MDQLRQYLHDIATLEGQLYTQNWIISSLEQRINPLGYANNFEKPKCAPWKPNLFDFLWLPFLLLVVGFIPGTAAVWFCTVLLDTFLDLSIYKATASFLETIGSSFYWYMRIATVLSIVGTIAGLYLDKKSSKEKYKNAVLTYNEAVKNDEIRVRQELMLRTELWNQMQNVICERNKTQSVLSSIYDIGIIHPKYRYMVAVSSFYDYFDTGRCLSLTGPGGAYAVYEEDLRFQRLETRLDMIINKLDELINNQRMIADLMREANDTLYRIEAFNNRMMQSVSRIEQNSELIEYNSRCAMQSSVVMEHIMVYNALKNN